MYTKALKWVLLGKMELLREKINIFLKLLDLSCLQLMCENSFEER